MPKVPRDALVERLPECSHSEEVALRLKGCEAAEDRGSQVKILKKLMPMNSPNVTVRTQGPITR